jgi:hypothetical protein
VWYWKALKSIGADVKVYKPCDGRLGFGKDRHHSSCSFEKRLSDFGIIKETEETLKQYVHLNILAHLLSVMYNLIAVLTSLTESGQLRE